MDENRKLVDTVRQQQHTGNHEPPPGGGPDIFGGTRAGAHHVERKGRPGGDRPTEPGEVEASDLPERDKQMGGDDN